MTQQSLATATGVTRQIINAIGGSQSSPVPELALSIALVLGQPIRRAFAYVTD